MQWETICASRKGSFFKERQVNYEKKDHHMDGLFCGSRCLDGVGFCPGSKASAYENRQKIGRAHV
jgi:hypothetical protein